MHTAWRKDADVKEADKFKALNITVLTSPCAFSCGNLLPSLLKGIGYQTIGQKTGGGSFSIMFGASADGLTYFRSPYFCLSDNSGRNIDSGVEPRRFFDVAYVAEALASSRDFSFRARSSPVSSLKPHSFSNRSIMRS
ncbi:MAG: hypothetical protein J6A47_05125 [Bacilli bacterium]|nr:hypothetical protein [Bacilli bacterium]MBO6286848.1 hypothetical protein [Bacilli bacterium]